MIMKRFIFASVVAFILLNTGHADEQVKINKISFTEQFISASKKYKEKNIKRRLIFIRLLHKKAMLQHNMN